MNSRCPVAQAELAHDRAQSARDAEWESCLSRAAIAVNNRAFNSQDVIDALIQGFEANGGMTPLEHQTWWEKFTAALATEQCTLVQQLHDLLITHLAEQDYNDRNGL